MNIRKNIYFFLIYLITTASINSIDTTKGTLTAKECDKIFQICIKNCKNDIEESRSAFRRGLCKEECAYNLKIKFGCLIYYHASYK